MQLTKKTHFLTFCVKKYTQFISIPHKSQCSQVSTCMGHKYPSHKCLGHKKGVTSFRVTSVRVTIVRATSVRVTRVRVTSVQSPPFRNNRNLHVSLSNFETLVMCLPKIFQGYGNLQELFEWVGIYSFSNQIYFHITVKYLLEQYLKHKTPYILYSMQFLQCVTE